MQVDPQILEIVGETFINLRLAQKSNAQLVLQIEELKKVGAAKAEVEGTEG